MTRTGRERSGWWASVLAVSLISGCGGLPGRKPAATPAPSTSLLDTGPDKKVTGQGAADIQFAIGRSHEEAGKLDEAAGSYRLALKKDPKRGDIEARLAIVLDRKGVAKEADQHFEKALKLDPKNPDLLCDRGYSLYLRAKHAEAEASLRAALVLAPNHPRSHTNLGLVLAARGDTTGAMAEFTRAGTDPADARSNLALALALGGKMDAARDQYAQALAAKPGSPAATRGLKLATTVIEKSATQSTAGLPRLPGDPAPATVAAAGNAPRVDPGLIQTSLTR